MIDTIYLCANNNLISVRSPAQAVSSLINSVLSNNSPAPHIPELHCAITAQAGQLGISCGVPSNGFNAGSVTLQLRRVLDMILLRVPYTERAIACTCSDKVPERRPCECLDGVVRSGAGNRRVPRRLQI